MSVAWCGSVYVGETGKQLKARIEEHKKSVWKPNPNNAITAHMWNTGHGIQWSETMSMDHEVEWYRKRVKEALYIRNSTNAMNSNPGLALNPCQTAFRTQFPQMVTGRPYRATVCCLKLMNFNYTHDI